MLRAEGGGLEILLQKGAIAKLGGEVQGFLD